MTGTSAAPNVVSRSDETGLSNKAAGFVLRSPKRNPHTTNIAMARIFKTIRMLCTVLPARTPRQLMTVSNASTSAARRADEIGRWVSSTK